MDESIVKHLEAPQVGTLKLSEAIRIGAKLIPETFSSYCGCALGTAYLGLTGRRLDKDNPRDDQQDIRAARNETAIVAELFGVPERIAVEVEERHLNGEDREEIADWLEAQGL